MSPAPTPPSSDIPNSDDLAAIYGTNSCATDPTNFSDECEALNEAQAKNKRGRVVQRAWQTRDIFHSDPPRASSPITMPTMTSSPPVSPLPQRKRKLDSLDLGNSSLGASRFAGERPVKAQKVFYGINVHQLLEDAQAEEDITKAKHSIKSQVPTPPAEPAAVSSGKRSLLWTEKYRAKKFTDLIGDERTHRNVMHWLKRWDQIVFPGSYRPKPKARFGPDGQPIVEAERAHRKILMLTGPPGLGKTTLAHVCAKQAGYEVQEINASDERSSGVVKGRIRDMVGTENVRNVEDKSINGVRKAAKPVCVIVDEVDGVVGGSGGTGEGGFVKALIDLIVLDQKNSSALGTLSQAPAKKKQRGDRFRLLRPLILVCNDVYHPALRPLRQSNMAEVIHVRKPPVQSLVTRLHQVFEKEGIPCDGDGVRRLCEATWGVSNRKEDRNGNGAGEGDMRGIMVVGEWVAGKLRATSNGDARLTRKWVEDNILADLTHGGGAARGLGRGGPKDIVERVFKEGAGFPKQAALATPPQTAGNDGVKGVAEGLRRTATSRLRELIDTHGDTDRIMTDCFSTYPELPFQDDTMLSKPDSAYEWLNFHDRLSGAVFSSNEWELAPYLSTPVLAFHHLFASATTRAAYQPVGANNDEDTTPTHPFSGSSASWAAHEAAKANESHLQTLQQGLSLPLLRSFHSHAEVATDLQPYLLRMLTPNINPITVGGSGKDKSTAAVRRASELVLVKRAVNAMSASGVRFERVKMQDDTTTSSFYNAEFIFRIEPPLDSLCTFETGGKSFGEAGGSRTRYAVRQVIDQEYRKEQLLRAEEARMARFGIANSSAAAAAATTTTKLGWGTHRSPEGVDGMGKKVVRDFFGRRVVVNEGEIRKVSHTAKKDIGVWITFREGYSNAVRKPLTLGEFMGGL